MKYYSIIITLALISCLMVIFWPKEPSKDESRLIDQRDSALLKANTLQAAYDLKAMHVKKLEGELLISKAAVERSEQALDKTKASEKVYLKRIKEQSLKMTDVQADSAIKSFFRDDPDSIEQKVVVDLAKLDACDSVRLHQESLITSLRESVQLCDSVRNTQSDLLKISDSQKEDLYSALDKDNKIIEVKDKQVRRLRRQNKVLKIAAPILFIVGVLVAL